MKQSGFIMQCLLYSMSILPIDVNYAVKKVHYSQDLFCLIPYRNVLPVRGTTSIWVESCVSGIKVCWKKRKLCTGLSYVARKG